MDGTDTGSQGVYRLVVNIEIPSVFFFLINVISSKRCSLKK